MAEQETSGGGEEAGGLGKAQGKVQGEVKTQEEGGGPSPEGARCAEAPFAASGPIYEGDRPQLRKEFGYSNVMQVPRLEKVVVNMGLGEAIQNNKVLETGVEEMSLITGQRPVVTRAKRSIAGFKLRAGMTIGAMVTLRGDRMYEFFDRLVNVAIPRVRDFKGVSGTAFDGRGNYSLGIREQVIFPEIHYDKIEQVRGFGSLS